MRINNYVRTIAIVYFVYDLQLTDKLHDGLITDNGGNHEQIISEIEHLFDKGNEITESEKLRKS